MFLRKKDYSLPHLTFGVISKEDLLNMGADQVAYMKEDTEGGVEIYAGNGTLIGEESDLDAAITTLKSHNIFKATLH